MAWLSAFANPIDCWYSPLCQLDPNESIDMLVCVLPSECLLHVADDTVGLQIEFPSSKLVRLDEKPVPPNTRGRDRDLEPHRLVDERPPPVASAMRPLSDDRDSEGAWLSVLGLRLSIPMTERLVCEAPPG
jgi:hypothetical protein